MSVSDALAEEAERHLVQPRPDRRASAITKSRYGNAIVSSIIREMIVSTQPR